MIVFTCNYTYMIDEPKAIKVADECWIALAKLTREHPDRLSFSAREILERVRKQAAHHELRPGIQAHIHLHNVANVPPNTARYRMSYRLEDKTFKLYRSGDPHHPERTGKTHPNRSDVPVQYHELLDWYESEYCGGTAARKLAAEDPILKLRGLGSEIWSGIDPDAFVDGLRSGWESDSNFSAFQTPPSDLQGVWESVVKCQGAEFKTKRGYPFTYRVEGDSGIWFERGGKEINQRLWRRELEKALSRLPLHGPADLKDFRDSSYLYGLLTDPRIVGRTARS
jgi:hypothetical protein